MLNKIQETITENKAVNFVTDVFTSILPDLIKESGLNDPHKIFEYACRVGYRLIPTPFNILFGEETFVNAMVGNKDAIIKLIGMYLKETK